VEATPERALSERVIEAAMSLALAGKMTAQDALNDAVAKANALIK